MLKLITIKPYRIINNQKIFFKEISFTNDIDCKLYINSITTKGYQFDVVQKITA